jgi:hypothetical protein
MKKPYLILLLLSLLLTSAISIVSIEKKSLNNVNEDLKGSISAPQGYTN